MTVVACTCGVISFSNSARLHNMRQLSLLDSYIHPTVINYLIVYCTQFFMMYQYNVGRIYIIYKLAPFYNYNGIHVHLQFAYIKLLYVRIMYCNLQHLCVHAFFVCARGRWHTKCAICTSYHMATRTLANLSHEGAKRPRAIN